MVPLAFICLSVLMEVVMAGFLSLDGAGSTNTVGELQSQLESAVKLEESDSAALSRTYQECLTTGAIRGPKRYVRF